MELQQHEASSEMKVFFEKLLEIKEFVRERKDQSAELFLEDVYKMLDEIIKEKK